MNRIEEITRHFFRVADNVEPNSRDRFPSGRPPLFSLPKAEQIADLVSETVLREFVAEVERELLEDPSEIPQGCLNNVLERWTK